MRTDRVIPKKILCVEDDQLQSDMISEALRLLPARVDTALTAGAALHLLRAEENLDHPYDLLTVDMRIPRVYGEPAMDRMGRHILQSFKWMAPKTEVIVYTAYPRNRDCVECLRMGAYDYIPKLDEAGNDGLTVLVDAARHILYPSPDDNEAWLSENISELSRHFGGKVIGVFKLKDVKGDHATLRIIGGRFVCGAPSMRELRSFIVMDPMLQWLDYYVAVIPLQP